MVRIRARHHPAHRLPATAAARRALRRTLVLALLLSMPGLAPGVRAAGVEPATAMDRALAAARAGDRALARSWLEPVLLTPGINRAARARAYYLRGLLFYDDGLWVSAAQDYQRALEFLPTLAEAREALAWLLLKGRGVARDPDRAVALYRLAAREGNTDARFNLALLLMKDDDRPRAPKEALAWFLAAADDGNIEAAALAGQLLARGDAGAGLAADPDRARPLLERAADAGHPGAALELGLLLLDRAPARAAHWLQAAAGAGVAAAQAQLGHLYETGARGTAGSPDVPRDPARALMWFREAAKQGDASAQSWLGWAYDAGVGVDPDPRQALRWYQRAARRDDPTAQVNLAQLYRTGRGTPRSDEQARYWYEQAARQGEVSALSGLAWLLATTPDPAVRDGKRALGLARRAVERSPGAAALDALAAALAETGQFQAAVDTQQRAIEALRTAGAGDTAQAGPLDALRSRLQRYRDGRPWRAEPANPH